MRINTQLLQKDPLCITQELVSANSKRIRADAQKHLHEFEQKRDPNQNDCSKMLRAKSNIDGALATDTMINDSNHDSFSSRFTEAESAMIQLQSLALPMGKSKLSQSSIQADLQKDFAQRKAEFDKIMQHQHAEAASVYGRDMQAAIKDAAGI